MPQKLELTWVGKDQRPQLEPRILLEDARFSYHAPHRVTEADSFDNKLIFGDNLLALRALEAEFTGRVKCVFIDPPYNTGSAFTHYDDGLEHSIWLGLMRDRLEIIRRLLSEDGSLWITIDDNECHYLKVLCDEVFGRQNFVANVIWQKVYAPKNAARFFSVDHDHILVFSKAIGELRLNPMPRTEKQNSNYKNLDNDSRGLWRSDNLLASLTGGQRGAQFAKSGVSKDIYDVIGPTGKVFRPRAGTSWRVSKEKFKALDEENRIWWGKDGNSSPALKRFLNETKNGRVPQTFWSFEEVGHTQDAKKEVTAFNSNEIFSTPKPEYLIKRILEVATNPNDLVLDSFAGSGTTGAVAHKMGRRWIMIELGDHCHTHIIPRLQKVINGTDQGGISKAVNWQGGGGFRYYKLAPSLLQHDRWGNLTINPSYNAAMLAEALCKLHGYTYAPSETLFWQHGYATERSFIYTTTQTLTFDQLQALAEEVGEDRTLLIIASAWRGITGEEASTRWRNLTLKKIPHSLLNLCEWGKDDYSLNIANLPLAQPKPTAMTPTPKPKKTAAPLGQGSLFAADEG
ncbi:MAG: site-specific DNA-methyltransferase [Thiofilum sp.]|uniref:site-specific DNA-methyltransferase n=1 Tax=Thiofilum sp. TaxID=2212733 RepID=UPI0025FB9F4C|nr:site-specific DNA-methyltransferase [Thiofilum sp.]MBK8454480.1 site-specific DNA-methyltransferase [Thiofilum sp.]